MQRAIEEGADFIQTDILATKDGALICFQDVYLDDVTNVIHHKEFANHKRTYEVQGSNTTGFFTVDFTLEEIKTLRVKWAGGKRFEDKFTETLQKYGYKGEYMSKDWMSQPIFIQFFGPTSLIYVSNLTDSLKIFIIDDVNVPTQDTNQSYSEITSDAYFDYIKQYVVGIRPWKDTFVPPIENHMITATDLLHPYTYRNEFMFLHFNFHHDPYAEYGYWINKIGIDGLFTDFTGNLRNFQDWTSHSSKNKKSKVATTKVRPFVCRCRRRWSLCAAVGVFAPPLEFLHRRCSRRRLCAAAVARSAPSFALFCAAVSCLSAPPPPVSTAASLSAPLPSSRRPLPCLLDCCPLVLLSWFL
ncbi:hypothetical protein EJ110_NYTH26970 [Nymphaea thermarum]|nr:hypothetical protein EJ110_NYTH26970 [Nymphaea thermarum]